MIGAWRALVRRWLIASRSCEECGARRSESCDPFCTGIAP